MKFFTRSEARSAAKRATTAKSSISMESALNESVYRQQQKSHFDIFLSHSIRDSELILGVKTLLEESGFTVYVDWITDPLLERDKVNADTADVLRKRMRQCQSLIYIYTSNSKESKWMPWELGYFDGFRPEKVSVLPLTFQENEEFKGQEYLDLYPVITKSDYFNELKYAWVKGKKLSDFVN
ncbi:toll/interleukin-1 receptor domain-containing protein [Acinetobacter sp. ULE_I010]|uniref:toll/interleukin-1 receptor domain-containing protein n=1 Tax=Acinetobacter sp. ULE_I010 TaxID=3373065 RepID=UPI003AF6B637